MPDESDKHSAADTETTTAIVTLYMLADEVDAALQNGTINVETAQKLYTLFAKHAEGSDGDRLVEPEAVNVIRSLLKLMMDSSAN